MKCSRSATAIERTGAATRARSRPDGREPRRSDGDPNRSPFRPAPHRSPLRRRDSAPRCPRDQRMGPAHRRQIDRRSRVASCRPAGGPRGRCHVPMAAARRRRSAAQSAADQVRLDRSLVSPYDEHSRAPASSGRVLSRCPSKDFSGRALPRQVVFTLTPARLPRQTRSWINPSSSAMAPPSGPPNRAQVRWREAVSRWSSDEALNTPRDHELVRSTGHRSGKVIGSLHKHHGRQSSSSFLVRIDNEVPQISRSI